jgi:transketolase
MRTAFIKYLMTLAERDPRVWLLTGDLGFSVLEPFAAKFPERYINVGVAEQNMTGLAAGLALSGKKVFTYSIANFAVTRCLEQIRNDVCYHNADVTIVATGGGLAYGTQGYTHHGIEDIGFTRLLPNINVIAPADAAEVDLAMGAIAARSGPSYLRLARGGEPVIHTQPIDAKLFGRALMLRPAGEVAILTTGSILGEAVAAADRLTAEGIKTGVYSVPVIQPLDEKTITDLAYQCRLIVTVEEHVTQGGLGGAVAEVLSGLEAPRARLERAGVIHGISPNAGSHAYLRHLHKLDADGLVDRIRKIISVPAKRSSQAK